MKRYLYLSLSPEALISSMLPPEDFGIYVATGTKKRTRGQALFFEVNQEVVKDQLPLEYIERRCVPQEGGRPKSSVYLSIYRVLESIPLKALQKLYLVTDDGRVLGLSQGNYVPSEKKELHLYQELCPVTPRIASTLAPLEFVQSITGGKEKVSVPRLAFVELQMDDLATDPEHGKAANLPYQNIPHLRDCLLILKNEEGKDKKTIIRFFNRDLFYRTIKNGFFVGDKDELLYYPFPSISELEEKHYPWWRSANTMGFH
ncbi:MAG: hypothetical protein CVU09_07075 [Bacteroidetes bacterium HGW-Bacteroidetes-4]|jgi:hypothetical protein|nr:MAG: hypothetical protein CVU09_07075 [Bacteroidetes bacterium HGW-Bacteroidetes-4]